MKNNKKKDISQLGLKGKRMFRGELVDWNPLGYLEFEQPIITIIGNKK